MLHLHSNLLECWFQQDSFIVLGKKLYWILEHMQRDSWWGTYMCIILDTLRSAPASCHDMRPAVKAYPNHAPRPFASYFSGIIWIPYSLSKGRLFCTSNGHIQSTCPLLIFGFRMVSMFWARSPTSFSTRVILVSSLRSTLNQIPLESRCPIYLTWSKKCALYIALSTRHMGLG